MNGYVETYSYNPDDGRIRADLEVKWQGPGMSKPARTAFRLNPDEGYRLEIQYGREEDGLDPEPWVAVQRFTDGEDYETEREAMLTAIVYVLRMYYAEPGAHLVDDRDPLAEWISEVTGVLAKRAAAQASHDSKEG